MRIVGGIFGGRRFNPPSGIPARPTTDLAREGLFNVLNSMTDLDGAKTLELFGGTGSISYELASRGAENLTIVERDPASVAFIKKTVSDLNILDKFSIIRSDAFKFLKQCSEQYAFIFADPPYALENMDDLPELIFSKNLLAAGGIFVLEHSPRNDYQKHPGFVKMKNYGTTTFSFFTNFTQSEN